MVTGTTGNCVMWTRKPCGRNLPRKGNLKLSWQGVELSKVREEESKLQNMMKRGRNKGTKENNFRVLELKL
jgi:hypothetical protein